jgi:PAS domain-containing protein
LNTWNPHFLQLFQYNQEELIDSFHFARLLPYAGNAEEEWVNLLSHPLPTIATNISLKRKDQSVVACVMELYKQTERGHTTLRIHIRTYAEMKPFSEQEFSSAGGYSDRELIR